jgi:hypothetical protein
MPKVRKTLGLCNRACKRFVTFTAASSECESSCCLHGLFPEEKIAECSKRQKATENPQKKGTRRITVKTTVTENPPTVVENPLIWQKLPE